MFWLGNVKSSEVALVFADPGTDILSLCIHPIVLPAMSLKWCLQRAHSSYFDPHLLALAWHTYRGSATKIAWSFIVGIVWLSSESRKARSREVWFFPLFRSLSVRLRICVSRAHLKLLCSPQLDLQQLRWHELSRLPLRSFIVE